MKQPAAESKTITTVQELGAHIKQLRKSQKLSQEAVSYICGVNRSAISRLERGKLEWVSFKTVLKVLDTLDITVKLPTHTNV